jgi:GntR family transcriptional repressor for pyruvate dehydrogenase complex
MPEMIAVRRKVLRHMRAGEAEKACGAMTRHLRNLNEYLEQKPWMKGSSTAAQPARATRPAARKKTA